jgi:hypothetical protein
VLNLAEGPVQIGPSGLKFNLAKRVAEMSAEHELSKEEAATAAATATALEQELVTRPSGPRRATRRSTGHDGQSRQSLAQMRKAEEILVSDALSPEERRKADVIVEAVAGDIVADAPRRIKRKKKMRTPLRR